jgi:hypothetical protein
MESGGFGGCVPRIIILGFGGFQSISQRSIPSILSILSTLSKERIVTTVGYGGGW